jgi:hypothetical protein
LAETNSRFQWKEPLPDSGRNGSAQIRTEIHQRRFVQAQEKLDKLVSDAACVREN